MTFGNAGGRGGGGASTTNVDIDGSGNIDADEANVRSVPDRQTATMPAQVTKCNDCVSVEDLTPTTSGTVTVNSFVEIKESVCDDTTYSPQAGITSDECGGSITNEVSIVGQHTCNDSNSSCEVTLTLGTETVKTFACCEDLEASASSTVIIEAGANCGGGGQELECGQYSTFSQGGFGGAGGPYNLMAAHFSAMFPSGLVVGSSSCYTITLTSATAVQGFLPTGGTAGQLTASLTNPPSSNPSPGGTLSGQTITLAINIALSDGGYTPALCDCDDNPETPIGPSPKPYGDLVYCNGSGDALSGLTVRQILAVANNALGCGTLPTGYTFASLTQLLDDLRGAFEPSSGVCQVTAWALEHLTLATSCPE